MNEMGAPGVLVTGLIAIVYAGIFVGIGFAIIKLVQIHATLVRIEQRLANRSDGREV